ncbi:VWA domain-containing protein, partial [Candidatus Parcubacteria bacterium]|nr:VWA domain-containing protein [Candidatus Parcubacteria bacterium]
MNKSFSKFPAQGWSASGGKTLFSLCVLLSFVFLVFSSSKDNKTQYVEAAVVSCKGPADVMLVIDRSGTMGNNLKFSNAKSESSNFVDKLFSAIPEGAPTGFNYHQIGLVAFNQLTATANLAQTGDEIKSKISDPEGILGDSYPIGSRNTDTAIQQARLKLGLENGGNLFATKTMIILTDGAPNNLDAAKTQVNFAKSNNIRIISIGIELDAIEDGTIEDAKEFIKYASSSPTDCYYIYDSGDELENCTSISLSELGATLDGIYDSITAAVCDESPPTISISRKPSGTLYNVDKLTITSEAIDDIGFKSHEIMWSDDWENNVYTVECADLMGSTVSCGTEECTKISCNTGELGSFPAGEIINYRSSVIDTNDNEMNIDTPDPRMVTVAGVSLDMPTLSGVNLFRNRDNPINVAIHNPSGEADLETISITIDAPAIAGIEIEKAIMTCSWSGSDRACTYNFNPDCSWTNGTTDGVANDIGFNVYIHARSSDMEDRQIASSENNLLVPYFEGKDWSGTCTDEKNNDCNYDILSDPIIDSEEMLCDIVGPDIGVSRLPSGAIYDFESDGITPMTVTISSDATDSNGIKQHTIYYKENNGAWQNFDCTDADSNDGKIICDGIEMLQDIASISKSIGSFVAGTKVDYYSVAIDYSGNNNLNGTTTGSFVVRNRSCFGIADLENCIGVPGKCCGEVCNSTISNPNNYNTNCAQEICGDALLYEEDVRVAGIYGNAVNFDGVS